LETVQKNIETVKELISASNIVESMLNLVNAFSNKIVFSTSFSNEDQLLSHLIFSNQISISVFTLDTGRLFAETYSTWARTTELYQQKITAFYPAESLLQNFVTEKGPNSFYESVENRKQCCYLRKVEPLQRALKDKTIWITGISRTLEWKK
jgi:phosphoadenosine phosphosulfate reductase